MRAAVLSCLVMLPAPVAAQCIGYKSFRSNGSVVTGLLPAGTGTETSGVVASRHNPGVIWVHDDKGNGPYVLALRANGSLAQQYFVTGVSNRDWEDIAIGPGPVPGKSYIYIGELGNNGGTFTTQSLIRIPEPDVPPKPGAVVALKAEVFAFRYAGGPRDGEALFIDPWDGTPFILTKERKKTGRLWRYPLPLDSAKTKTVALETTFFHATPSFSAADIAPDGRRIYFRNASTIYWVKRKWGEAVKAAFGRPGCSVWAGNQGNAEALAVTADGLGLFAISEGKGATVWTTTGVLPPSGPRTVASSWCYGSATRGLLGSPGIGALQPPILAGPAVTWAVFGARPRSSAVLAVSLTALPDGLVRFAGGWLHVLPDVLVPLTTDLGGNAAWSLGVLPDVPALRGVRLHAQAVIADPTGRSALTLSRGMTLQLDR